MKLDWIIESQDILKVNDLIDRNKNKIFYKQRLEKNIYKKEVISDRV